MRVRGPLQECLWPIGQKLDFYQMAAPIPEIMVGSLYVSRAGCNSRFMLENTRNLKICNIFGAT
jgi:hypothetical protein